MSAAILEPPAPAVSLRPAMDANDIADFLKNSRRSVERMLARGAIPGTFRVGRLVRVNRDKFEEWVKAGCPGS